MVIARATPEELPAPEFTATLESLGERTGALRERIPGAPLRLVYLGRLEPEKLVGDLIEVAGILHREGIDFELVLIGDGTERAALERRAAELGVAGQIVFQGFRQAPEVAVELAKSDIFLSTLTGTALKEAAFARLAVVAYAIDYVPDIFTHGENCLLAQGGSASGMAAHVVTLQRDPVLRAKLASSVHEFAHQQWSPDAVRIGLERAFGEL